MSWVGRGLAAFMGGFCSLASVLTANADSFVHFCLIETAVKCVLNLLVQITSQ